MKTKTTKEVEKLAFEKFSTWTIVSHLYKRHEVSILYTTLLLTYTLAPMHALGVF